MKADIQKRLKIPLIPYEIINKRFIGDQSKVKKKLQFAVNNCNNTPNFKHWSAIILINGFGYLGIRKIFLLILLLPLCSYGQNVPKGATTAELIPHIGQYNILWNSTQSDTVAVYMLVGERVNGDYPLMLRQIKGYSVTPRIAYNSLPFATYLDNNKKPMPDDCIVWMSVKR